VTVTLSSAPAPVTFNWGELSACVVEKEGSALAFYDGRWIPIPEESAVDMLILIKGPVIEV